MNNTDRFRILMHPYIPVDVSVLYSDCDSASNTSSVMDDLLCDIADTQHSPVPSGAVLLETILALARRFPKPVDPWKTCLRKQGVDPDKHMILMHPVDMEEFEEFGQLPEYIIKSYFVEVGEIIAIKKERGLFYDTARKTKIG